MIGACCKNTQPVFDPCPASRQGSKNKSFAQALARPPRMSLCTLCATAVLSRGTQGTQNGSQMLHSCIFRQSRFQTGVWKRDCRKMQHMVTNNRVVHLAPLLLA